jgi:hypothetical protein
MADLLPVRTSCGNISAGGSPKRCVGLPPCPAGDKDIPMTARIARADVPTDAAVRYAEQLLSHVGRPVTWTKAGDTSTAQIAGGTGRVRVRDGVLTLIAEAPDVETLIRLQHILGSHLERSPSGRKSGHLGQRRARRRRVHAVGADRPPTPRHH